MISYLKRVEKEGYGKEGKRIKFCKLQGGVGNEG
jgi:hypothetical protein